MDISDQQMKQLAAGGPIGFSPLNYMNGVQAADSFSSSHFPNYNLQLQHSLVMNSSSGIGSLNKASDAAAAHMMSPSCISLNPGNNRSGTGSISVGLDQIPGLYGTTFDYNSCNQIYQDQASMFNITGVDSKDLMQSSSKSMELACNQKLNQVSANHCSTAKSMASSSGFCTEHAGREAARHDAASRVVDGSCTVVKSEPEMDHFAMAAPALSMSNINRYPSKPYSAGTSVLHSLMDMEQLKEEAHFDQRSSGFDHSDTVASTSSSVINHSHHLFDFANLPLFSATELSPCVMVNRHQPARRSSYQAINEKTMSTCSKTLSSQMGAETTISSTPTRCKAHVAPKRRKSQQKRVICVPATGGVERPTGECLPSDSWAWRKYGQKPIKNSPYPRSYYKCSSVKGCTARKQVERNPSDPLIIIITYTVEHSHPSTIGDAGTGPQLQQTIASSSPLKGSHDEDDEEDLDKPCPAAIFNKQAMVSADGNDAVSEESCEPISSEGTYHEESMIIDQQSGHDLSFADHLTAYQRNISEERQPGESEGDHADSENTDHVGMQGKELGAHKKAMVCSTDQSRGKAEEDVFSQLDELPDLFGRNKGWPDTADQGGITIIPGTHINIDPFDLYCWP